jgi:hypothetical protein
MRLKRGQKPIPWRFQSLGSHGRKMRTRRKTFESDSWDRGTCDGLLGFHNRCIIAKEWKIRVKPRRRGFMSWVAEDDRPVGAQIKSGLRKGLGIVGGMLVSGMALLGFIGLRSSDSAPDMVGPYLMGPYRPWIAICFAAVIMFVTADYWAGYAPGFIFLPGMLTAIRRLTSQPSVAHGLQFSRLEYGVLLLYYAVVIALLWPYLPSVKRNMWKWRRVSVVDRTGLTAFALVFFFAWAVQAVNQGKFDTRPFLASLAPLTVLRLMHRLHRTPVKSSTSEPA